MNAETDEKFMLEALKEAKKAYASDEVPVGAVLVYENKIIARGHNQVEMLHDATAHGEMLALSSASTSLDSWRLLDATLYCTLEPCLMCAGAMFLSRIKRLVYGAKDLRHGTHGSFIDLFALKHPTHKIAVKEGVLSEQAAEILRSFFQKKRFAAKF